MPACRTEGRFGLWPALAGPVSSDAGAGLHCPGIAACWFTVRSAHVGLGVPLLTSIKC